MLGIILGAYSCNYLYMHRMHWIYEKPVTTPQPCTNKLQTFANTFKPTVWTTYDWSVFASLKRYNQNLFFCFFCLGIDCSHFFLKYILWIPANHKILLIRVFMWAFVCIAAAKEYYEFISNCHCKRVGPFVWLCCLALGIELSVVFKFGYDMFTAPFPSYVIAMWIGISGLVIAGQVYSYMNQRARKEDRVQAFDPQEPAIDIEPVYLKKNN